MTMLLIYHFPHRKKVNTSFAAQASLLITYPIIMKLSPPYWFQYILSLGKPEIWGQMQEANDQTTGTIAAAGLLSQISFFFLQKNTTDAAAAIHCIEKILMWTTLP